ncbi:MAG: nitroreductase family deazaflavin-dependent oxidoreductase [Actinobacteria bacterium]|nr:nitroreductase family deazaflavin-dependent oxidoreductase [Actinomycetota bacterium]
MSCCSKSFVGRLVVVKLVVLGALAAVWFLGMRNKWAPVLDFQRKVNRRVVNPRQMRDAGTPGAYAAVIRHTGRISGAAYETPVVPFPHGDRYVIALPYGTRPDWVKNVLGAGTAELVHEGETFTVTSPVVRSLAPDDVPANEQRALRVFGNTECLEVRRVA